MATPEPAREPTIGDVLHELRLLRREFGTLDREFESLRQITTDQIGGLRDQMSGLRQVMIDEFAAARHLIQALDRDVQGIAQRLMEQGDES